MYVEFRDLGKTIVVDATATVSVQIVGKKDMTVDLGKGEVLTLKYENEESAYNDYRRFRTKLRKAYAPWCNKDGEDGDEPEATETAAAAPKPGKQEKPAAKPLAKPAKK